ncbi:MAG: beta-N-acetylhexosaminidase [Pseudomonadota bacterium]
MTALPFSSIVSVAGPALTDSEKRLFAAFSPAGFILFSRNIETPVQLAALTRSLRETVGWHCPILIDQEGGRVARLRGPHWPEWPSAVTYGPLYGNDIVTGCAALTTDTQSIGNALTALGIDVNCAPVADVATADMDDVLGQRCYSDNPDIVARAAQDVCHAYLDVGVIPVIKHLPGHGRATADSHHDLPVITASRDDLTRTDFAAFRMALNTPHRDRIWGMAAHVLMTDIDPVHPTSLSSTVISQIIRDDIGLTGLLMGDDVDMQALRAYGDAIDRALASVQAGCDVALYCAGSFDIVQRLAHAMPPIDDHALHRMQAAGYAVKGA